MTSKLLGDSEFKNGPFQGFRDRIDDGTLCKDTIFSSSGLEEGKEENIPNHTRALHCIRLGFASENEQNRKLNTQNNTEPEHNHRPKFGLKIQVSLFSKQLCHFEQPSSRSCICSNESWYVHKSVVWVY